MTKRIQRKRTKGFRMPPDCIYVGRPSRWGNPYYVGYEVFEPGNHYKLSTVVAVVERFRRYAAAKLAVEPLWLEPLRGKDLACWCKTSNACHADVLLELLEAQ